MAKLEAEVEQLKKLLQNKETRVKTEENSNGPKRDQGGNPDNACYKCKQLGHYASNCPTPGIFCYGCGAPDVTKPKCPDCSPGNDQRGSK